MNKSDSKKNLIELILFIMENYIDGKEFPDLRQKVHDAFRQVKLYFEKQEFIRSTGLIEVKFGMGIGRVANVPWISFLDTRITDSTQRGIYAVFLFNADMSGFQLALVQGVGRGGKQGIKQQMILRLEARAASLRGEVKDLVDYGFRLDNEYSLKDEGSTGPLYERTTIAHKSFERNSLPSEHELIKDLESLISVYIRKHAQISAAIGMEIPQVRVAEQAARYNVEDFYDETGYDTVAINMWKKVILRKRHLIFQGPPGTGKTFVAERLARLLVSGTEGIVDIVQFHPSYSYEDFLQGLFPEPQNGILEFRVRDGRFIEFCEKASSVGEDVPCVLIIDEINRANLSQVFGELMYAFEYRNKSVRLAVSGETFTIPENVYVIGTMNTADRSTALVDHALRRRFAFIRLSPNYKVLENHLLRSGVDPTALISVIKKINKLINDPNFELGISYFIMPSELFRETLPVVWKTEIEPYIEELFFDQPGKLSEFKWEILANTEFRNYT